MKNLLNLKGLYGYSQSVSPRTLQPSDEREMSERRPRDKQASFASSHQVWKYAAMVVLMLTLGVGEMWGWEYTIYCVPKELFGESWVEGSNKVKVWWKTNSGNTEFAQYMSKTDYTYGGNYIYQYKINSLTGQGADRMTFQRFSSSDSYEDGYDAFTSWWGQDGFANKIYIGYQSSAHRWMTYCHDATYYFIKTGTSSSWAEAPNAHAWNAAQSTYATTTWPGIRMTDSGKTYKGKNIYSITFNNPPYSMVKFNNYSNSDNQSGEKSLPCNEGKIFDYEADNWLSYHYDHQVTFDGNGNTGGSMTAQTMPYNTATAINANSFTREGYTFIGWNTKADGSGDSYAAGANITVTDEDVTLYAQWVRTGYFITGGFNGWSYPDSCVMTATGNANEYAVTLRFKAADFSSSSYKTQIKLRDYNSSVGTWYSNNERGSSAAINKAGNNPTTLSTEAGNNMYLDVSISAGSYTFTYNSSTKVLTVDFPVNNRIDFFTPSTDYANMTLDGTVYSCSKELAANTTYTFKLEWLSDFYGNGSTFTGTNTIASLTSNSGNMTLKTTVAGEYQFSFNTSTKAFTVTYPTAYTVTYGMGTGGSSVSASAASAGGAFSSGALVRSDDVVTFTQTAATGYTFKGWYTTADGNITAGVDGEGHLTINAAKTVYAQYNPNNYVITLDKNTGSTDGSVTATYNSSSTKSFTAVTKAGYDCTGYWTAASGGYKVINANGTLVSYSSNVSAYLNTNGTWKKTTTTTLYAQWTAKTYTITLDDNGSYQGNGSATATYDGVLSSLTHAQRTGYHIDGYYKEAGLTNRIVNADGSLCASTAYTNASSKWTNDGAVTLYAKWTANTYTIAFDPNNDSYAGPDATGSTASIAATYGTSYTLTANGFSREGYTFAGWNTNADGTSGTNYTNSQTGVSNLTATNGETVTLYAKWTGKTYTVTFNARGGTGLSASNTTVTMGSAYSAGTGLSGSLPTLTAPDGFVFDAWYTAAEGGTKVDEETLVATPGDHTLYAHYIHQTRVYFKNTLGWSDVYVTYDATWNNDRGAGNNGKTYHKMTLLDAENKIYVDVIPEDVIRSWKYNIAFNDRQLGSMPTGNHESWNSGNAVFRRDFDSYATMFVPCPTKSYDKNSVAYYSTDQWVDLNDKEEAINYRYKNGYWICYNDTKSGYTIKGSWDGWANDSYLEASQAGSSTFFMKKQLAANTTYQFLLYKHCKTTNTYSSTFTNTGTMTDANCSNWTFTTENAAPGSTTNAKITTKAAGEYTFKVEYTDDGQIKMSVVYPFAVNDYRVVYNWNDGSAHTHSSEIIRAAAGTNETISVFVHKAESPIVSRSLKIQQCTVINGSGIPTWTDRNTIDLSSISENGVYNFVITQPASGYATGAYLEPYKGDYYIRTASADGGWDFYKEYTDNKMTLSEYSMTQTLSDPYSHYYCRYIVSTSVDITYTIATDYSPSISDTLIGDATIGGLANKTLPASANVRFTWNQETNAVKRSYLKSAQGGDNTRYLVLHGSDSKVLDKNGTAIAENVGKSMAANELLFDDLGNWTYQVNLKAQPGAAVSLIANYNGADRYLVGGADTWETIISGSSSTPYNIVAVYDFKTNRLMTAWTPEGDITEDLSNVDILLIRYQQEAGTAITFGTGGSKVSSQSVIGAIRFDYNDMVGKVANWTAASRAYLKYFISFPFDVNVSDIFGLNSAYGDAYVIEEYDGKSRAEKGFFRGDGTTSFWKEMKHGDVMKANVGYCVILDNDYFNNDIGNIWQYKSAGSSVYLYFPAANNVGDIQSKEKTITIPEHECKIDRTFTVGEGGSERTVNHMNTDSHWNMMGVPVFVSHKGDATAGTPGAVFAESGTDGDGNFNYFYEWSSDNQFVIHTARGYTFKSMHGYMVQYHGNVTFTGATTTPAANVAARHTPVKENYQIELQVLDDNEDVLNRTYVELRENADDEFILNEDVYLSPNNHAVEIFTFAGNYDVAANVLPIGNKIVPVGVEVRKAGTYTFSMPSNFSGTVDLVDTFNGERTNLAMGDYSVYLEKGYIDERFVLEINVNEVPTAIDGVEDGTLKDGKAHKFLQNGVMYILRNGVQYDAQGKRVK